MAAEVGGDSGAKKKGQKKGRKPRKRPRIDMTPMVDLGFLLLTFFVLTTTMSTPQTMPVVVPPKIDKKEDVEPPKITERKVITLLITGKDRIFYYTGVENPSLYLTDYSPKGIRQVLLERRQEVEAEFGKDEMIVLIKMDSEARYKNMVDILDEMNIIQQRKYALVNISPEEKELIREYLTQNSLN
ncbi:MAG: ExbD/TolR family protein [Bacteroidia bacterium]